MLDRLIGLSAIAAKSVAKDVGWNSHYEHLLSWPSGIRVVPIPTATAASVSHMLRWHEEQFG
jgi:hypothetical protein